MPIDELFDRLPRVETERAVLRPATFEEAERIIADIPSAGVQRTILVEASSIPSSLSIDKLGLHQPDPWIVTTHGGVMLGIAAIIHWHLRHARGEMVMALAEDAWEQEFGEEIAQAVVRFGFEIMELNRIDARVGMNDESYTDALKNAGLVCDAIMREQLRVNEIFTDIAIFASIAARLG